MQENHTLPKNSFLSLEGGLFNNVTKTGNYFG